MLPLGARTYQYLSHSPAIGLVEVRAVWAHRRLYKRAKHCRIIAHAALRSPRRAGGCSTHGCVPNPGPFRLNDDYFSPNFFNTKGNYDTYSISVRHLRRRKTRVLARYAKTLARNGEKVLIVQKTIKLINATVCDAIGVAPFSVTPFHCDNNGRGNVAVRLSEHFKDAGPGGEIVVTTHETFAHMTYFEGKAKWHVIVDEIPQIDDRECSTCRKGDSSREQAPDCPWYNLLIHRASSILPDSCFETSGGPSEPAR